MSAKNWFWAIVEAVIWYGFIYYLLYVLKNPVDLWTASLVLLALGYAGAIACPWFRRTEAWEKLVDSED